MPEDSPARKQLKSVTQFARQASAALGLAHQALAATAHPVRLVQRSKSGRSYLLGSQVQSYGLAISLAFVTLLLGAAVLTLERDENVLARLLRAGTRPRALVAEKIALCAIAGCGSGCCSRSASVSQRRSRHRARPGRASRCWSCRSLRRRGLRRARLRGRRRGARPARRVARRRRADHADRARRPGAA